MKKSSSRERLVELMSIYKLNQTEYTKIRIIQLFEWRQNAKTGPTISNRRCFQRRSCLADGV